MKDLSGAFIQAESLMRKYGLAAQADEVRKGLAAVQADRVAGLKALAKWWSGPDSLGEVYLHREGETFTVGQERDNRALRAALTTIQEAMRGAGG